MTKIFAPTPGFFYKDETYGGWNIVGNNYPVAFVPIHPERDVWQTECDAMLMAGGPEMLDMLVTAHNRLSMAYGKSHGTAEIVMGRVQDAMRASLVKVVGGADELFKMGQYRIIMPPER